MQKIEFHHALVKKFDSLKAEYSEIINKIDSLAGIEKDALQDRRIIVWNEMVRVKNKADAINTRAK